MIYQHAADLLLTHLITHPVDVIMTSINPSCSSVTVSRDVSGCCPDVASSVTCPASVSLLGIIIIIILVIIVGEYSIVSVFSEP